jgi:hypothetical protein
MMRVTRLMEEYLEAKQERERTGFDINTFALFWVLKQSRAPAMRTRLRRRWKRLSRSIGTTSPRNGS